VPTSSGLALRIVNGAMAGALFPIPDGSTIIGRSVECAIVVPDPSLSRRHFELLLQNGTCRVIDLDSRNGVLVNGAAVLRKRVRPGDEIHAGDLVFKIEADRASPRALYTDTEPTLDASAPPPPEGTLLAKLQESVQRTPAAKLYALVDGAQAFELAFAGRLMGHDIYSLFSGSLARVTAPVGPILVALGDPSAYLQKWIEAIGRNAGVLFESAADLDTLYAHLRDIFVVTDEEQNEYFFRFYDPRVLRVFLPTCREDELSEFFGPVACWIVEGDGEPKYSVYSVEGQALARRELVASAAPV
jgi:hypothetical protein